jgi:prevent-host-death family protein
MSYIATARDANHRFSQLLRDAEAGQEIIITRNGKPVARLIPEPAPTKRVLTPEQEQALAESEAFARQPRTLTPWTFNRDEIYEERLGKFFNK